VIIPLALSLGVVAGLGLAVLLSLPDSWTLAIVVAWANVGYLVGRRLSSRSRAQAGNRG
jgi:hypothetical protein